MATAKKKTGLKKVYIKKAGGDFKKAWKLQKAGKKTTRKKATAKKNVARKKVTRKKVTRKSPVRKLARTVKKTIKKVRRKNPVRKVVSMARKRRRGNPGTKLNIQKTLTNGAMAAAGAIGASALANMIPIPDPRIKAVIPIAAAIVLPTTKLVKGEMANALAMGMLTIGAVSLVRQFVPNLPLLAGEEDTMYLPEDLEQPAMLGYGGDLETDLMLGESIDVAGESIDIAGEDDWITEDDV